ncbi:hypothetical protein AAF712_012390 [Marasmius tenuissimus]|uniref:Ketoreductase (KR) domain-containing protein n=1 Tax=Marasmius tenuissimus TaxID=585030 RepID=A0ABR2ZGK2_9AGAR
MAKDKLGGSLVFIFIIVTITIFQVLYTQCRPPQPNRHPVPHSFALSYLLVGIFVGGTSGIGQGMADAFADHTEGNAHIVIVGRNKAAAEGIIANFPQPSSSEAKHGFVRCDVTLMENVQKATTELL